MVKKKGMSTGIIVVLAIAALGSCVPKDKDTAENTRSIPAKTEIEKDTASQEVLVTLPPEIDVIGLNIDPVAVGLCLGEKKTLNAVIAPKDATDKTVIWTSSNDDIVAVDKSGVITAVSPGTASIIATASSGISSSASVEVDGSKRTLKLSYGCSRMDDNNIGNEWTYVYKVNGETAKRGDYLLGVGDVISLFAEFTEADSKPDVGNASAKHTVTADDLTNGFTEKMNLSVTENGGKNSGKRAEFIVKFSFEVE